ncbi:tetratricopeptide repeat protein [Dethiobacter alkaliphilus]|uniref:Tetratricopeptide TPR_2 repeat protein n=1 Tax=Dethiobacter alkaliphilus AHT 1 TaxID=555088 RepID=C0GHV0_DETAL|nr:tetratricopeptide repeat protein [Dethiobacter alkaliphilus]EEG77024.1 Tetratricopeptide TPR_2 repeat protein [Dethiobacter alkaliphilus AHT 1]
MKESEFTKIIADLERVEKELKTVGNNKEKRQMCYDRLLELRKRMDRYVEYWLLFEEKINDLQERYDFFLPDELPESFLHAFDNIMPSKEDYEEKLTSEEIGREKRGVKPLLLQADNEACIRSFRRGLGFLELAMMDEAIKEFRAVISQEPDLMLPHLCLGVAYAERGMGDEAMRELRLVQALTDDPQTGAIIHNAMGNIYADREEYQLALEEFKKVVELDPEFSVAYFNLGAVYYNLKQYQNSVAAFEAVKDKFPRDWELYFYLGKAFKKLGNEEQALVNLLKSSHLAHQEPFVAFELGLLYDKLGETRKALECYYRARRLYQELEGREMPVDN